MSLQPEPRSLGAAMVQGRAIVFTSRDADDKIQLPVTLSCPPGKEAEALDLLHKTGIIRLVIPNVVETNG